MRPGSDRWSRHILASLLAALFLALSLIVEIAGSMPGDERVLVELNAAIGTSLDDAMVAVGRASDTIPLLAASAVVAIVLTGNRRRRDIAAFLAVVVVAMVGNRILKEIVGRPRPDVRPSPESVSQFSFPSGHAANTLAVWAGLLLVVRTRPLRIAVLALGVAVLAVVGFSRLAIGVHYPSDLIAGWLWVAAWSALVWSWQAPRTVAQQKSTLGA